jgi:regulatory protein YycH of two-component signal transduction system YycFG
MLFRRVILQILFLLFLQIAGLQAQETLLTAGGDASGSGGSISYSIGQVLYTFNTGNNGTEAQGVQQPYEISVVQIIKNADILKIDANNSTVSSSSVIDKSEDVKFLNLKCIAYPNPTSDILTLSIEFPDKLNSNLSYQLFDLNGKLIESKKVENSNTSIDMNNLVPAAYILNVNKDNISIKTFKIIKN